MDELLKRINDEFEQQLFFHDLDRYITIDRVNYGNE